MKILKFDDVTFYNSIYEYINSNMYLIVESGCALVIDPHYNAEIDEILKENDAKEVTVFLTHEHPDHISGLRWLNESYNTKIICQDYCAKSISSERATRPMLITFVLEERDRVNGTNFLEQFNKNYVPYICNADITFEDKYEYKILGHKFYFKRLLGHSKGSCCITMDEKYIFTGDTLLKDYPVITRFPGGNKKEYMNSTIPFFEGLDKNLTVLPGHGNSFVLKEIIKDNKLDIEFR